jgi:apolipoprotein N-acyltransferase-like protein
MLFWGTGLQPLWFLTWFAPLPVLLISSRLVRWGAFSVGVLSWFLGSLNMWHYLLMAIELPLLLVLVLSVVPACFFGLAVLLFRRFIVRGSLWKAALAFPTFWVTCEYVNNVTSPHGTFPNMGYTQMDLLPLLQVTSVVGIWGVSFCLFLLPAATLASEVAALGERRSTPYDVRNMQDLRAELAHERYARCGVTAGRRGCTAAISPATQVVKQEFLLWGESSNGSTGIARPTATSALACFRMGGSGSASEAWTARTPGHNITQSIASPGTSLLMVSG